MADGSWKKQTGFSERLTEIVSITSAYRGADPSTAFAQAQQQARAVEEEAFEKSESKEEYQRQCRLHVEKLLAASLHKNKSETGAEDAPDTAESAVGIDIGSYKNAVYHSEGIYSTIYKARSPDGSQRLVALKLTTPAVMTPPHNSEREARILKRAASPQVISLLETFRDSDGHFVLSFPFMPHSLAGILDAGTLSTTQKKSHLRALFQALEFLHAHDIIHRDIKPSNILLGSPDGPAFLADFGIAWAKDDPASEASDDKITDVGTTCYRAPELLFGNTRYGPALDLWAAGCVVAETMRPKAESLFEAGPLGSELALIHSLFSTLGTPTLEIWPEAKTYPDWGKMQFHDFPPRSWDEILAGTAADAQDLVSCLVRYESSSRLSAAEALKHEFFA